VPIRNSYQIFFGRSPPLYEGQDLLPSPPLYTKYLLREFRGSLPFKNTGPNFYQKFKIMSFQVFIINEIYENVESIEPPQKG
jgi:hypothetical protein